MVVLVIAIASYGAGKGSFGLGKENGAVHGVFVSGCALGGEFGTNKGGEVVSFWCAHGCIGLGALGRDRSGETWYTWTSPDSPVSVSHCFWPCWQGFSTPSM